MTNKLLLAAFVCFWAQNSVGLAEPDFSLIKDFLGTYPILELNLDPRVAGTIEVVADSSGIGYRVSPLAVLGSLTAPTKVDLTPPDTTVLQMTGDTLTQTYHGRGEDISIEYKKMGGVLEVVSKHCSAAGTGAVCSIARILSSSGGAPGTAVEAKTFFQEKEGEYHILVAGGVVPHTASDGGVVVLDDAGLLVFQFCPPGLGSCDQNEVSLPFSQTTVYQRTVRGNTVYAILRKDGDKLFRYKWEEKSDKSDVRLSNFQYQLKRPSGAIETVVLEHALKKT